MEIFTKECGKTASNMVEEAINGVMAIITRAIFGWIKDKVKL